MVYFDKKDISKKGYFVLQTSTHPKDKSYIYFYVETTYYSSYAHYKKIGHPKMTYFF